MDTNKMMQNNEVFTINKHMNHIVVYHLRCCKKTLDKIISYPLTDHLNGFTQMS